MRPHVKERPRIVSYVGIRSCIFTRLKPQNMELLCSNLLFYRRTACMPLGKRLQENVHSEQKKKKYGGEVWQSARAGGWGEKNKANSTVELTSLPRRSIASPGCTFCSSSVLWLTLPLWTKKRQDKERSASLERRLRESSFYPSLTAARCTSSCAASAKAFLDLLAAPSAQR